MRWILLVGFALRVLAAIRGRNEHLTLDPADYARHAHSIAAGNGFPDTIVAAPGSPTAMRPPALPYLLGAAEAVTGQPRLGPLLVEAVLGTIAVFLIFFIARELFGRRAALWAAAAAAVLPPMVLLNSVPLSETLFVPLELGVLAVILVARRADSPSLRLALAAGVLCGLAGLTRQAGLLLAIPAAIGLVTVARWDRRRSVVAAGVVVVSMLLTAAPWTMRNASEFDRFIPVALQDGLLLSGTYNELSADDKTSPAAWRPPLFIPELRPQFFRAGVDEAELNDQLNEHGMAYMRDNPAYVPRVIALNTLRFAGVGPDASRLNSFALAEMGISGNLGDIVRWSGFLLVIAGVAGGIIVALRRGQPLFVWIFPLIMYVTTAPIIGGLRYRSALDPFLVLLAAGGLSLWLGRRAAGAGNAGTEPSGSTV